MPFRALSSALDIVLPPLCVACDRMVASHHGFCPACWAGIDFISRPYCACCGLPFAFEVEVQGGGENLCGACLQDRPAFGEARAALSYTDASRRLILPFKYHDRTDIAPAFARLMINAGASFIDASDVIVPVPLHRFRLFMRRYNQAALLAKAMGKLKQKTVLPDALRRVRATPSQGKLNRRQRFENVRGAFAVRASRVPALGGKNILLIDDVMTTGATVDACAAALLKAGAASVRVLCLARVSRDD